ncbi:MAG: hypothetical protein F4147_12470 [Gammaproteobacteria bacterium]|nr:hypothetical protein [Gammaproteobacteria bacterium]
MKCFLLERVIQGGAVVYLTGIHRGTAHLSFNPYLAVRFCRHSDAEKVRTGLPGAPGLRVAEHQFET